MSESTHDYYGRKLREVRENKPMSEVGPNEMSRSFSTENSTYRKNIADLQKQLQNSYIRQKQLNDELYELRKKLEQLKNDPSNPYWTEQKKWDF